MRYGFIQDTMEQALGETWIITSYMLIVAHQVTLVFYGRKRMMSKSRYSTRLEKTII